MSAAIKTLREKLHKYIDHVEDKKIKAFYTIVKTDIEENNASLSEEFKTELDNRYREYKSGSTKLFTANESKSRVQKLLKNKFKK